MPKFYPNGSAAPARLPEYLLVTAKGAWAMATAQECLEMARQLDANGVQFRTLRAEGQWTGNGKA